MGETCQHGKTLDEECPECEVIFERSGLGPLLDAMEQAGVVLADDLQRGMSAQTKECE